MKKISLEMIRRDNVKVELDPEFFNEEWFEGFSEYFYDLDGLDELAEHITYNVIHNKSTFIEGIGIPLRDGEPPYWIKEEDKKDVNEHVNIIWNIYGTEVEFE
ncbi:hypothetical protein ACVWIQ_11180 [Enterococcus faecium]|uniref:hypothetical protein n=1 Tax=Enterococcus faecium TaxID=1352 RepID=UPI0013D6A178|nr:hypothetical protein [Enterococcus faecium]EGO9939001.1 hypothetical protein [Enterococcus faecium]MBD9756495.1 hypothetical protein [Enterococcus faecium]MDQ8399178.1 hypothetical protein [Enterococcus faecium]NES32301.1 hypothetical protein [Enterococcus faecium]HAQ0244126.1 hypothetical protein [Enterococcus faecium]